MFGLQDFSNQSHTQQNRYCSPELFPSWPSCAEELWDRDWVLSSGATRSSRTTCEMASHWRQLEFVSKVLSRGVPVKCLTFVLLGALHTVEENK